MLCVYLLRNEGQRTYVGYTSKCWKRRLRQHNGELVGGARQTSTGRPWNVECVVTGFDTKTQALQFEFAWRRIHRRFKYPYTVQGRRQSLAHLCTLERWSRNAPLAIEVRLQVIEKNDLEQ